jgi:hypothetical protein
MGVHLTVVEQMNYLLNERCNTCLQGALHKEGGVKVTVSLGYRWNI